MPKKIIKLTKKSTIVKKSTKKITKPRMNRHARFFKSFFENKYKQQHLDISIEIIFKVI
jgi:hypothetical protein